MPQALSDRFLSTLALMKRKDRVEKELENLDASTSESVTRRDALQLEAVGLYQALDAYPREMGKIISLAFDSDDSDLSIATLTLERLAKFLSAS